MSPFPADADPHNRLYPQLTAANRPTLYLIRMNQLDSIGVPTLCYISTSTIFFILECQLSIFVLWIYIPVLQLDCRQ